jgi:hypothetical protein
VHDPRLPTVACGWSLPWPQRAKRVARVAAPPLVPTRVREGGRPTRRRPVHGGEVCTLCTSTPTPTSLQSHHNSTQPDHPNRFPPGCSSAALHHDSEWWSACGAPCLRGRMRELPVSSALPLSPGMIWGCFRAADEDADCKPCAVCVDDPLCGGTFQKVRHPLALGRVFG